MIKYYTRACNFYYGNISKEKIKKKASLPLNGNKLISFDSLELLTRKSIKKINIKDINKLPLKLKKKALNDLNKITKEKKLSKIKLKDFPLLMAILNTTPDSFSDGGKYLKSISAYKQIKKLSKDGADVIDIGGESTRPNSDTVDSSTEWKRIKSKLKYAKKNKIVISLDTRKSFILKKSLPFKINLLNDVSGLSHDSKMIKVLKLSKKRFIKELSGKNDSKDRIGGTASSCMYAILQGVQILRVHDVNEIKQSMKVFKKLIFNK